MNCAPGYADIRGHGPDFLVRYRLYGTAEGGRKKTFQHLRCDWNYDGDDLARDGISMIHPEFLAEDGSVLPPDLEVPLCGIATMWILVPQVRAEVHRERIHAGVRGFFMEGSRKIGEATILQVLDLHKNPSA